MSNLGQLIMTGLSGTSLTPEESEFIEKENIGGVLLFSENFESPAQLAELVNDIQKLRNEYPLFVAVDHEGGRVVRFKNHFTQIPPMLDLSRTGSPKIVFHIAKIMAEELLSCGININLAPVCDVVTHPENQVIGDRAFGDDAEVVSKYISSVIRGLQTNGILACAKHFPGHGCTSKDSHFTLPVVDKTIEQLREVEFQPFIKAVKSRVEFVMMAHLIVEGIDPELPCTLSSKAYELLREELKFSKIIITDDMQMQAITNKYSTGEAAVMAIKAGADIIEYRDVDQAMMAYSALKEALKNKELKSEDVKQKVDRIYEVKKSNLADYKPNYIPDIQKSVNTKASQTFMRDIISQIEEKPRA
ncbi:MAG: beta-N-acetylhexosaminidase [Bacteriovoracaceae bacterium]|nr:beta-N-acetylhexosaminidase [Bacteriovoracaceae bacterium]